MAVCWALLLVAAPQALAAPRTKVAEIPTTGSYGVAFDAHGDAWIGEEGGSFSEDKPYPSTEKIEELSGGIKGDFAVDSANGYLYVAKNGGYGPGNENVIEVFKPLEGHLVHVEGLTQPVVNSGTPPSSSVVVDNATGPYDGTVYVLDTCSEACPVAIHAYESDGQPAELAAGFNVPETATEIAIDGEGNVYAYDGGYGGLGEIEEYKSSGEFVRTFTGSDPEYFEAREHFSPINSQGYLYQAAGEKVEILSPTSTPEVTYQPVTEPTQTAGTLNATVDPRKTDGGGNITECRFEYVETSKYKLEAENPYIEGQTVACLNGEGEVIGTSGSPIESSATVHAEISALKTETTYHYRLVATNGAGSEATRYGADQTYAPHQVHGLLTGEPSEVEAHGALLHGTFFGSGEATHYYFEWGTTEKYGEDTAVPPGEVVSPGAGVLEKLSFNLNDLEPNTVYHYRIVAENSQGVSHGEDRAFRTSHSQPVIKEFVTEVQADSAVLRAHINPGGIETTYHFEYGTSACSSQPDPCAATPVPDENIGHGRTFQSVSTHLGALHPSTVYHYRVIATNERSPTGGTAGAEQTFTTFPFVPQVNDTCPNVHSRQQTGAALLLDCRAYELVSDPDTNGFDVESNLIEGQNPFPGYPEASGATGTSRLLYGIHDGGIPGTGHPTDRGLDPYVATRGPEGWTTEYVGIPADGTPSTVPFASTLEEADAGLDTFAFGGSEICKPCFGPGHTEVGLPVHLPNGELTQGMEGSIPQPAAKTAGYVAKQLSADGTHLVFGSTSQLAPGGNADGAEPSIYDRDLKTEETHVVSNEPGGTPIPCLTNCETDGIAELDISSNGSHILLGQLVEESEGARYWHLFMNVGDSLHTAELTPGASEGVRFDGMTADGTKVFFSSDEHLTHEDEEHSGADIYMWEEGSPLTLISKGEKEEPGAPGDTASCDPASNTAHSHWNTTETNEENCGVLAVGGRGGVASSGSTVYFLSPELLDGVAHGVQNAPNLYSARPGSAPHFVTTLESSANAPLPLSEHPFRRSVVAGAADELAGVAIDYSDGDVYTMSNPPQAGEVWKLDSSGDRVANFGIEGKVSGGECEGHSFYNAYDLPGAIAVDNDPSSPSYRDLYAPSLENEFVDKFSPSGKCLGSIPVRVPSAVAVNPSNGDLYVTSGFRNNPSVKVFAPSADEESTPIMEFPTIEAANGIAVDSHGTVYVTNGSLANEIGEAVAYTASGTLIGKLASPAGGVAVDTAGDPEENPDYNHVYVEEDGQVTEFQPAVGETLGAQIGGPTGAGLIGGNAQGSPPTGIAVDAGTIDATSIQSGKLFEFGFRIIPPDPETDNPLVLDSVGEPEVRHTSDFQINRSGNEAVFTSTLPLTGYDSNDHHEIFRYDVPTTTLTCVSCNPTGEQPSGDSTLALNGASLTADGRVFFNSNEALIDRDLNEKEDVYEWEPEGAGPTQGRCAPTSPTFTRASGGCLDLISTGISPYNSSLLTASSDGTDAFFFTREALVHGDDNGSRVRVYDARVEGGFPFIPPPVPCKASDECHGAGSPPPPPTNIQSVGQSPGGNESSINSTEEKCKKGFVKKHGTCVKKPMHNKHHKHHKRVRHERSKKHRAKKGSVHS
ncbi:MAG: hypothetical protein WB507_01660 [Solirubrobacterales bacterium]